MDSPSSKPPPTSGHHIYLVFCSKEQDQNTNSSNYIGRFDPCNNIWSNVSLIPGLEQNHVLKDFAMTSINDSIYIIGGIICRKDRKFDTSNNFSEAEIQIRLDVLRYDITSDQWTICAPLSLPRYNFACTVYNNKIYVAGGQYEVASVRSTSTVEVYDPTVNMWTRLPNMSRLRYKCVGVTWQEKIYVVGGFVEGCTNVDETIGCVGRCSAKVYNEQRGKWDLVQGMWQLDVPPHQIVTVEEKLFSSGDCLNSWKGHIEFYDGKLNMWNEVEGSQMKSLISLLGGEIDQISMKRLYITMAPIGPYLYFLTGYKVNGDVVSNSTISLVCRFDTTAKKDAWACFGPSHEERERELCSNCCVVLHI